MKPTEGNFADNALRHGVVGINIDGCRVQTADNLNGGAYAENPTPREAQDMWTRDRKGDTNCMKRGGAGEYRQPVGRFPANVILGHSEGCKCVGMKKVKGITGGTGNHDGSVYGERTNQGAEVKDYADEHGNEMVEDWECVEDCPVKKLGEQSGDLKSGKLVGKYRGGGWKGIFQKLGLSEKGFEANTGTAARFFKQVKEWSE
jgi:hypothetical protein